MKRDRIVFWQDMPSPHQAPWIRALADCLPDGNVTAVFYRDLSDNRLALGWHPPYYGKTKIVMSPDQLIVNQLICCDPKRTMHVFSGAVHHKTLDAALRKAISSDALVGILSEGRDWRKWRGVLRRAHAFLHERSYRRKVDFVLAIGRVGEKWFYRCGYDPAIVFPFCYVVEKSDSEDDQNISHNSIMLASIGQLIPRKRFDILLNALSRLSTYQWAIKIIGDGIQRPFLETMADNYGLKNKTTFMGVLDNRIVRQELARTDIFILASRWDGWGAVINEALMSGVPVICSDYCGASDMIRNGFNGEVFQCDSITSLAQALEKWIVKGKLTRANREGIKQWSHCIEGPGVAHYFLSIVKYIENSEGARPNAPWK